MDSCLFVFFFPPRVCAAKELGFDDTYEEDSKRNMERLSDPERLEALYQKHGIRPTWTMPFMKW